MVLDNFVLKSFQAVKRGHDSDLSKKLGIFKHPAIMISYREFRKIRGYILSAKLRSLYAQDKLNDVILAGMTYQDLEYVKQYDVELFKKIAEKIYSINLCRIQNKASPIRIAFFCPDSALWSCDRLYRLFENDSRFEPFVVVSGFNNGTPITIRETYNSTKEYFLSCGYQTVGVYDNDRGKSGWNDVGCPDIIFQLTPYPNVIPELFNIYNVTLNCLNVCIMYGLPSVGNYWVFDTPGAQLSWIYCSENKFIKDIIEEHATLGAWNVVVSGHPKMDSLLRPEKEYDPEFIWKSPRGCSNIKKIIYAPHHSIFNDTITFSTFHQNYREIYDYAKRHPDTTSWIVKPHPLLRKSTVQYGLFNSENEYDDYMDMWDALPNARTVRLGKYDDIFLTSDAMVMDCGSFLTEYTLTNKPLIFLRRPEQVLNEWGQELSKVLYSVPGDNPEAIFEMIDYVVLQGNDYLREMRESLLQRYLDFYNIPSEVSSTASGRIYYYIKSLLNCN